MSKKSHKRTTRRLFLFLLLISCSQGPCVAIKYRDRLYRDGQSNGSSGGGAMNGSLGDFDPTNFILCISASYAD